MTLPKLYVTVPSGAVVVAVPPALTGLKMSVVNPDEARNADISVVVRPVIRILSARSSVRTKLFSVWPVARSTSSRYVRA